ncbi:MAG TPA: glycosyltransferase family 2 protein [Myxococcota bacterium]|nr:glycosyltransferase family 2 protein [Myxococcota bacterium]
MERPPAEPAPRVSIGLPVYNGEDHVAEAIESVLAQTYRDLELVICDNASTDRTEEICRELAASDARIRFHRNAENLGATGNFRRTFELARGEYFNWLSHDDILGAKYVERCVDVLDHSPESVVLSFSPQVRLTYEGEPWRDKDRMAWYEANPPYDRIGFARLMLVPDRRIPPMLFGMARRTALARTGLLPPVCYSDLILVPELRLQGEFREISEPLYFRRSHRVTEDFKDAQRRSVAEELRFYDPKTRSRTRTEAGALWILLRARLDLVRAAPLPRAQKLGYLAAALFGHAVIRSLTPFSMARLHARNQVNRAWEAASVALLRWSGESALVQRAWTLLSAVRHRDRSLVTLALAPPSAETRGRLRAHVEGRLQRRRDVHARRLLREWEQRRRKDDKPVQDG